MEEKDLFLIHPHDELDIIVNDNSSFSNSFICEAKKYFNSLFSLKLNENALIFPSSYQEDYVQVYKRTNFSIKDWDVLAVLIDINDSIIEAVLISKSTHKEGLVFNLTTQSITTIFYRGFKIKEFNDTDYINDSLFLESLGLKEQTSSRDFLIYYNDNPFNDDIEELDDNEQLCITVVKPTFEANFKRKIVNYGSKSTYEDFDDGDNESEEEDIDLEIEIEKPLFVSNSKSKVRNLGYSGSPNRKKPEKEQPSHVDVTLPAFKPASKTKVTVLIDTKKRNPNKTTKNTKQELDQPNYVEVSKPNFVPLNKNKVQNYDELLKHDKSKWMIIDVYKLKPNYYEFERSCLNNSSCKEKELFNAAISILSKKSFIEIDDKAVFVPHALKDDDSLFSLLSSFNINDFYVPVIIANKDDKVMRALLVYKKNITTSFILDFDEEKIVANVLSTIGVSLDDKALPYYNYENLLKVCEIKNG